MKNSCSFIFLSITLSLGTVVGSCGDYSVSKDQRTSNAIGTDGSVSGPGATTTNSPGGTTGTTGTPAAGGTTGTTGTPASGGKGGTTGTPAAGGKGGPTETAAGTGDPGGPTETAGTSDPGGPTETAGTGDPGGPTETAGTGGDPVLPAGPDLPCDLLNNEGLTCVSAHSTVRLLTNTYSGPLYQVCKGFALAGPNSCVGETQDIGVVEGGYADAAAQDTFCAGSNCTISTIYDQSGYGNDLAPAPRGGYKPTPDLPANAAELPVTINGHAAYGILIKPDIGYRAGCRECRQRTGNGTAINDEPQTMYMVTSQHDLVDGCCFNYGNAETTCNDDGNGTMEAVYFGGGVVWGTGFGGKPGPWVMADLENGLYAGWENRQDQNISTNTALHFDFVTAIVIGDTADKNGGKGRFALYGGDATAGTVTNMYDGIRPEKPGYVPMHKQGSIILGIGGDNSNFAGGRFYEGVMSNGVGTQETVDALQESIVAAGYGK